MVHSSSIIQSQRLPTTEMIFHISLAYIFLLIRGCVSSNGLWLIIISIHSYVVLKTDWDRMQTLHLNRTPIINYCPNLNPTKSLANIVLISLKVRNALYLKFILAKLLFIQPKISLQVRNALYLKFILPKFLFIQPKIDGCVCWTLFTYCSKF